MSASGSLEENIDRAARLLLDADYLLVSAGAGFSAESGITLPEQYGNFPAYRRQRLTFVDLYDPKWIHTDPDIFYGFWGSMWNSSRSSLPHEGYDILFRWKQTLFNWSKEQSNAQRKFERTVRPSGTKKRKKKTSSSGMASASGSLTQDVSSSSSSSSSSKSKKTFSTPIGPPPFLILTTNFDGLFSRAGFEPGEIVEMHGNLDAYQCSLPCCFSSWRMDPSFRFEINTDSMRAPRRRRHQIATEREAFIALSSSSRSVSSSSRPIENSSSKPRLIEDEELVSVGNDVEIGENGTCKEDDCKYKMQYTADWISSDSFPRDNLVLRKIHPKYASSLCSEDSPLRQMRMLASNAQSIPVGRILPCDWTKSYFYTLVLRFYVTNSDRISSVLEISIRSIPFVCRAIDNMDVISIDMSDAKKYLQPEIVHGQAPRTSDSSLFPSLLNGESSSGTSGTFTDRGKIRIPASCVCELSLFATQRVGVNDQPPDPTSDDMSELCREGKSVLIWSERGDYRVPGGNPFQEIDMMLCSDSRNMMTLKLAKPELSEQEVLLINISSKDHNKSKILPPSLLSDAVENASSYELVNLTLELGQDTLASAPTLFLDLEIRSSHRKSRYARPALDSGCSEAPNHPLCRFCRRPARPNVKMIHDDAWVETPTEAYYTWEADVRSRLEEEQTLSLVVLEIGCGKKILPVLRENSERLVRLGVKKRMEISLIRIDAEFATFPAQPKKTVPLRTNALNALALIHRRIMELLDEEGYDFNE